MDDTLGYQAACQLCFDVFLAEKDTLPQYVPLTQKESRAVLDFACKQIVHKHITDAYRFQQYITATWYII